ncbi:unnamed protein product [Anisakis simplex]|uniref:SUN domain-containing protein n=1 Tax=Anisakis simplex TaxID=6269 RepID=A0A3P6ND23_ANISI|nr:unnamed protein product [Anisakis simplex]
MAHSVMIIESGQSEDIKQIQLQINNLIKDEVARNLRSELSNLSEKSENEMESVREDIYKQIENRVMTLFAAQVARTVHESGNDEEKIIEKDKTEANHLSESDLLVVRNLIVDALRVYDADKTGKVDYALESSGGSIISTRCTETYKETSRLESIFGIPLWYSSYSPRSVIQVSYFFF